MSLLIAPYNNAMRLGQGFNSYTQQICVDDAVVMDPDRAENVITNDGTTMRIMSQVSAKPSVWNRQREVVNDDRAHTTLLKEKVAEAQEEAAISAIAGTADVDVREPAEDSLNAAAEEEAPVLNTLARSEDDSLDKVEVEEVEEAKLDEEAAGAKASAEAEGIAETKTAAEEETVVTQDEVVPQKPRNWSTLRGALAKSKAEETARRERAAAAAAAAQEKEENERIAEQAAYRREIEKEAREDERVRRAEEREEQRKLREEKRAFDQKRREENLKAIADAADTKALSLQDLEKIKAQNQFADRFAGITQDQENIPFDASAPRGPSQTVIYTSRFVDRLSDVTDDMSVSGSLSIKAAKIGGSGKGSFVDSDKFKESDLNFYISVKVVNQTLNFKDALVFNPLRSVDETNFQQVYGDSFISGFLEGGEFNALVSMKILNKAKLTDIKAEAKVAFTAGPIDVKAEANVGIARSNIETNTETTIQVSWSGGGHIKPMEQQWDIQSLMAAAARFPDLVADAPQRTYAILTKYDSLRSFVARKPAAYTPLQYENAQIYTNALLDSFMSYKSLYKRLGEQIFSVQGKSLEITSWEKKDAEAAAASNGEVASAKPIDSSVVGQKDPTTGLYPYVEDLSRFEATVKGLGDARTAIRRQMMRIVNEVDLIEKDPKKATDEDHHEPFQSPVTFETRLPDVVIPEKLRPKNDPLTGKRIMAKTMTEEELQEQAKREEEAAQAPSLYTTEDNLSNDEMAAFDKLKSDRPGVGYNLRASTAIGASDKGVTFNNLDFLQPDWTVDAIRVEISKGAVASVEMVYNNGLYLKRGKSTNGSIKELASFRPGERVAYASIESGNLVGKKEAGPRILSLRLYTNQGRRLLAQATKNEVGPEPGHVVKDGNSYENVASVFIDSSLQKGTLKGFFGQSMESVDSEEGIARLGLIWGDITKNSDPNAAMVPSTPSEYNYGAQDENSQVLQDIQTEARNKQSRNAELEQKLATHERKIVELEQAVGTRERRTTELEQTVGAREHRIAELEQTVATRERRVAEVERQVINKPSFEHGDLVIHFITFGGQIAWAENVRNRCFGLYDSKQHFTFNPGFFDGWDPLPGHVKSAAILYHYKSSPNTLRCLIRKEGEDAWFD